MARNAVVRVLNQHHSKRIKQTNLDFYRHDYAKFVSMKQFGGEILFIIALKDGSPVGISACSIARKTGNASRSITVVNKNFRRNGIGKMLLAAKVAILRWQYPGTPLTTNIAKDNIGAVKMADANRLYLLETRSREEDGKTLEWLKYSTSKVDSDTREHDNERESGPSTLESAGD
jgi:GNAT superfamily N-acetyltransferase